MREEDIRPADLKDELFELLKKDRELWLKDKDKFVRVSCPACNSNRIKEAVDVRGYAFETCLDCDTVYYNPRPTLEQIHNYYKKAESYNYWATKIFPSTEKARRENIFIPLVERVVEYVKQEKLECETLLEIGAGFGIFCEEISHKNVFEKVIAVEPTPFLAKVCRSKELETIESPYEDLSIRENSISCIASFEVIEHLVNPAHFLQKCYSLLEKNGLMIITCPNIKGFDFTVLGKENAPNFGLEHINMFHPDSIRILFESQGFSIIDICTPGKLDADIVRNQVLEGKFEIEDNPFLEMLLIEKWELLGTKFQKFLSENSLSSNMLVVARKMI